MKIRESTESGRNEILSIHKAAFGEEQGAEIANLVDDLLEDETALPRLSLVAIDGERMVGHILYTSVSIAGAKESLSARILAPLAVRPESQKQGIGQELINEGLNRLKASGVNLVFVLGDPGYYTRCRFIPAGEKGFCAPYPIPEAHAAAWMVQELNGHILGRMTGTVQCCTSLDNPKHWTE